jgi:membrane-bound ClpP family serine protease
MERVSGGYEGSSVIMKAWYQSKIVWTSVLLSLVGILELFVEWYQKGDFSVPGIVTFVIGVLLVILRIWFTDTAIE